MISAASTEYRRDSLVQLSAQSTHAQTRGDVHCRYCNSTMDRRRKSMGVWCTAYHHRSADVDERPHQIGSRQSEGMIIDRNATS